MMIVYN